MFAAQEIVIIPNQIDDDSLSLVGYRALSRYRLSRLGLPIPSAFVVTSKAFYTFLSHDNGLNKWRSILENAHAFSPEDMVTCSQSLQKLILHQAYSPALSDNILATYSQVLTNHWAHLTISPTPTTKVPVNYPLPVVKGGSALLDFLRQIWSAQLTPHALSLHLQQNPHSLYAPSPILISQFEPALASGSVMTIDPQTKDKQVIRIEAIWGTNPQTDPHIIPPDTYIISKTDHTILSRIIVPQKESISIDHFGHYRFTKTDERRQASQKLTEEQMQTMAMYAIKVHDYAIQPQLINWLLVGKQIYFTRYKPLEDNLYVKPVSFSPPNTSEKVIATGLTAAPGLVTAPIVRPTPTTTSLTGRVAIFKEANPQLLQRARQAAGIIIESGGLSSELAMTAREAGIPTIVGTGPLSIRDGQTIILDAIHGTIKQNTSAPAPLVSPASTHRASSTISTTTATHVYVNVSQIDQTWTSVYQLSKGVGLCRGVDILCQNRIHPKFQLKHHPKDLTNTLSKSLLDLAEHFGERPIYYKPYDLDTFTASKLQHGEVYEPTQECNPLIGYRGAARLVHDSSIFQTELTAIANLRHQQHINTVSLVIPFLRSTSELIAIKQQVAAAQLYRSPSFKIFAEIGTPSAVNLIPQWNEIGLDGFVLNLDLLAALTLGFDPNAADIDQFVDCHHSAVLQQIQAITTITNHVQLPVIAVGYQLDQSIDTLEAVIKQGIQSISISPARYEAINQEIMHLEAKIASTKSTDR